MGNWIETVEGSSNQEDDDLGSGTATPDMFAAVSPIFTLESA